MMILENFARNLKIYLREKNLKQNAFAKLVGVSATCVSKWLLQQREPTLSNIYKITEVLNCSFEDLIS